MRHHRTIVVAVVLAGCKQEIDLDPLDDRAPIEARVRPHAIVGGTLTVANGIAVAADPDRDLVHVVDLDTKKVLHTVALEASDEPGRVAIVDGVAHVVLRGAGGLASVDLVDGSVARRSVCPDPRGIAHHADAAALYVACADGTLVELDERASTELGRTLLQPDLRDVIVKDGEVMVSRFRPASLVGVDGREMQGLSLEDHVPHVAWRTFVNEAAGGIVMLHQVTTLTEVPLDPTPDQLGGGEDLPYGGGSSCEPGITLPALSVLSPEGDVVDGTPLLGIPLVVDAAMPADGGWVALAMPGAEEQKRTMRLVSLGEASCGDDIEEVPPDHPLAVAQVTAVAFSGNTLVMFSREPAQLLVQSDLPEGPIDVIALEGESRYDTGHEIFHRATESGLSCASCHPEGTDDGHVWSFDTLGKRRTQSLDLSLVDTAPFHWNGDMDDLDMIMSEVLAHRMGGKRQSDDRADSFSRWMFEQKRPPARAGGDDEALVADGEALFEALACTQCHRGPELGGSNTETVLGQKLQVPSLRRVALRPPFMHDGRSKTLEAAVEDMIVNTTPQQNASPDDVAALTAYLRTL